MTLPAVAAPAGFVPVSALSFAGASGAVGVDSNNPLPTSEPAFRGAVPIVVGTEQPPRRGIAIVCESSGSVRLKLADDSELTVPAGSGLTILPFQVKTVLAAGTTALAAYANLI